MSHDPNGKHCPKCPSTDGYKIEPDTGWGHCFVCGINVPPDKAGDKMQKMEMRQDNVHELRRPPEVFQALPERGISAATAAKYRTWKEGDTYFFPSFSGNKLIGVKSKFPKADGSNDYRWQGKQGDLYGQWLFPEGGKYITVVEGYEDAMAGYELMGSRYPVVGLLNGTGTAKQDVKRNWEYLNSFETIVFCLDGDEAGDKAAKECGAMFPAGKVKIVHLRTHNDPNDYLKANAHEKFTREWWAAPTLIMDGLKLGRDMWDEIVNRPSHFTTSYPWQGLNTLTYGIRLSELIVITAETKIGKTSILKEIEYKLLMDPELIEKNYGVGFLHLEEPNYDTVIGLMSIHKNKPYHLPDTPKPEDELREAYDAVVNSERVVIWDHFGSNSVDAVVNKVRHMAALGCKYIVLDHLSIVVSDQAGDERKQLDEITTKLKTACMELNIALICVIHQNRAGQIRGTAGVEQLANITIKLHRDKLDLDPWRRNVTKVVVQDNRFCGRTGPACYLFYNEITNRLTELTEAEVTRFEEGGTLRDDEAPWG